MYVLDPLFSEEVEGRGPSGIACAGQINPTEEAR
jgi:hypothetical protein